MKMKDTNGTIIEGEILEYSASDLYRNGKFYTTNVSTSSEEYILWYSSRLKWLLDIGRLRRYVNFMNKCSA